ncbi:MAG: hypothetical protein ACRD1E_10525, partial [Terriglobales bacterium]
TSGVPRQSIVLVFLVSSLLHMALPWHKRDYRKLPNEDEAMTALRGVPPGDYMLPHADDMAMMRTPEFRAKIERGPKAVLTVMHPGPVNIAPALVKWFIYLLVVAGVTALLAAAVLRPGAASHAVFHLIALASWLGYSAALWQFTIWHQRSWAATLRSTLDGLLYAFITAGVFVWLWPR